MRHALLGLTSILAIILTAACASVDARTYDAAGLRAVTSWSVGFAYETGSIETTAKSSGEGETRIVKEGQLPSDLQLRDDIFFALKDNHGIVVTPHAAEATGRILLHPLHFRDGSFGSVTVTCVDVKDSVMARLKIENGDRNATCKDADSFARYAAKAIAEILPHP